MPKNPAGAASSTRKAWANITTWTISKIRLWSYSPNTKPGIFPCQIIKLKNSGYNLRKEQLEIIKEATSLVPDEDLPEDDDLSERNCLSLNQSGVCRGKNMIGNKFDPGKYVCGTVKSIEVAGDPGWLKKDSLVSPKKDFEVNNYQVYKVGQEDNYYDLTDSNQKIFKTTEDSPKNADNGFLVDIYLKHNTGINNLSIENKLQCDENLSLNKC
jgi:hypothetical protein